MRNKKQSLIWLSCLFLLLGSGCSFSTTESKKETAKYKPLVNDKLEVCSKGSGCEIDTTISVGYNVGDQMPNVELETFDGKHVKLYDLVRGNEVFILNLGVDWCSDCKREKKKMNAFYEILEKQDHQYNGKKTDVASIFIMRKTNEKNTRSYVEKENFLFPTYLDREKKLQTAFHVSFTPTNIILDKNARIKSISAEIDFDNLIQKNLEHFVPEK